MAFMSDLLAGIAFAWFIAMSAHICTALLSGDDRRMFFATLLFVAVLLPGVAIAGLVGYAGTTWRTSTPFATGRLAVLAAAFGVAAVIGPHVFLPDLVGVTLAGR